MAEHTIDTATIADAVQMVNTRKSAAGVEHGRGTMIADDDTARRVFYAVFGGDVDTEELGRWAASVARSQLVSHGVLAAPVELAAIVAGAWIDGLAAGMALDELRRREAKYRIPYVGFGHRGAEESAVVDLDEAMTHPDGEERRRCEESANAWRVQARELAERVCATCGHPARAHEVDGQRDQLGPCTSAAVCPCGDPTHDSPGPCPCEGFVGYTGPGS